VNEKRIREVIEVEQRALEMLAHAKRDAEQIPIQAEAEAAAIVENARAAAQDEARRMIEDAQKGDEATEIISQAQANMSRKAELADQNLEKAVTYVVERVLGRA
jgi:vacuolar-type H+-ATPase subunit H